MKTLLLIFIYLLALPVFGFSFKPTDYFSIGCDIISAETKNVKKFPGQFCQYSDNGIIYSASAMSLVAFNSKNEVLWKINGHFHHQLNFSNDKKSLLALSSDLEDIEGGKKTRFDKLMVISIEGKVISEINFNEIQKQTNAKVMKWSLVGKLEAAYNVTEEKSHFNSFYEIPEIKSKTELPEYLKKGNFIVNGTDQGLYILSSDLKKVLYHTILPTSIGHNIHDVQVLKDGSILYFNNFTNHVNTKLHSSSVELASWGKWKINRKFEAKPRGIFFSEVCGGVQLLDSDTWLFSDFNVGLWIYSLTKKEFLYKTTYKELNAEYMHVPSIQQVRLLDLENFLKARN